MKKIKKIGFLANCNKSSADVVLRALSEKARDYGLQTMACAPTAEHIPDATCLTPEALVTEIDLLMVLGGDGTMLRAVRLLNGKPVPVLGVNLGSLGFLTNVAQDRAIYALECAVSGNFVISPRSLAVCRILRGGRKLNCYRALNDVVIDRGASPRIATLELLVDEQAVSSYICDGLIVSTPTGSTGHSLSAGGPILHPGTAAWVISLICPHTLSVRPLVVPDQCEITVRAVRAAGNLQLSVDGQSNEALQTGDEVRISADGVQAQLVQLPDHDYFAVLRQKLHWRGSNLT